MHTELQRTPRRAGCRKRKVHEKLLFLGELQELGKLMKNYRKNMKASDLTIASVFVEPSDNRKVTVASSAEPDAHGGGRTQFTPSEQARPTPYSFFIQLPCPHTRSIRASVTNDTAEPTEANSELTNGANNCQAAFDQRFRLLHLCCR